MILSHGAHKPHEAKACDRSAAAERRRMWLCLGWALCDAAELLDAAGVAHNLWRLAIPVDRGTARAAADAADAADYAADAAANAATADAAYAAYAAAAAAAAAAARAARATVCTADAAANAAARWDWCDARLPARLRVLCEVSP